MSLYHPNIMIAWITLWDTNFISFPWWMVMTTIYYCRSFWVQNTFSLLLAKPPIYCMGGKYFFSSGCLVIMSLLFYKWNRCRYVIVHYDTMLLWLWAVRIEKCTLIHSRTKTRYSTYSIPNLFIRQSLSYKTPFFCYDF